MTITTYTGDGYNDVNSLVTAIVNDLIGNGSPIKGTAAPHMQVIYPVGYTGGAITGNAQVVVLECTPEIDPFAANVGVPSTPANDPWRIAFHVNDWQRRGSSDANGNLVPDPKIVNSLAVYVGTPATIAVDSGNLSIGWSTTRSGVYTKPYLFGNIAADDYSNSYRVIARDLIEPLGNTGAEWTNTFDPTPVATKYSTTPASTAAGNMQAPQQWDGPDVTSGDQLFVNKWIDHQSSPLFAGIQASVPRAVSNSYRLTVSDHGIFLGIWGPDPEESGSGFSWLLVQRPVDKNDGIVRGLNKSDGQPYDGSQTNPTTGLPYPIGNRPLFCVNSVNSKIWKFTVREHDNAIPGTRKDATVNQIDSGAIINPFQQQSLTENGEYVITFLNNLNSSRFKYSDELDMLGTVSSDVVGGGSTIDVSVYNETEKRTYAALWSSGSYGTKMRIMVVEDIPAPNNPAL